MSDGYISVHNWRKFQHYDPVKRGQTFIKDHLDQHDKDDFRSLTFAQRGLLQDIRRAYARSRCELRDDTAALTRRLGQRVTRRSLDALVHAGFLDIVASPVLADGYQLASTELEVEREPPKSPNRKPVENPSRRQAERWIANAGHEVPPERLRDIVAQEFHLPKEIVDELLEVARQH